MVKPPTRLLARIPLEESTLPFLPISEMQGARPIVPGPGPGPGPVIVVVAVAVTCPTNNGCCCCCITAAAAGGA